MKINERAGVRELEGGARARNMERRRRRILTAAKVIIAREGIERLSLRRLAARAGITVPTVYNLIGAKRRIMAAIIAEPLESLERRLAEHPAESGVAQARAIVQVSVDVFAEQPEAYRAAFLAVRQHEGRRDRLIPGQGLNARCAALQAAACRRAAAEGDLSGSLDPALLGRQIWRAYSVALGEWTIGRRDVDSFRIEALYGLYVCLLADATPRSRALFLSEIRRLESRMRSRAETGRRRLASRSA